MPSLQIIKRRHASAIRSEEISHNYTSNVQHLKSLTAEPASYSDAIVTSRLEAVDLVSQLLQMTHEHDSTPID